MIRRRLRRRMQSRGCVEVLSGDGEGGEEEGICGAWVWKPKDIECTAQGYLAL